MFQYTLVIAAILGVAAMIAATSALAEAPAAALAGKKHFIRCIACHSMSADARPMTGPHLEGIVGRPAASLEDFTYSDAMRARRFVWDEAELDRFLKSPQADIAGLCLPFMGLAKPEDRVALIAYLKAPVQ